jgi:hypothetical protein
MYSGRNAFLLACNFGLTEELLEALKYVDAIKYYIYCAFFGYIV